jgi:hypothetical protein
VSVADVPSLVLEVFWLVLEEVVGVLLAFVVSVPDVTLLVLEVSVVVVELVDDTSEVSIVLEVVDTSEVPVVLEVVVGVGVATAMQLRPSSLTYAVVKPFPTRLTVALKTLVDGLHEPSDTVTLKTPPPSLLAKNISPSQFQADWKAPADNMVCGDLHHVAPSLSIWTAVSFLLLAPRIHVLVPVPSRFAWIALISAPRNVTERCFVGAGKLPTAPIETPTSSCGVSITYAFLDDTP